MCERAVVLWGSKLSNKPYFALKLWYREERPFGIHDNRQTDNLSTNYFPLSGNLERQCRIFRSLCVFIFIWSSSLDMSSSNTRNTMFRFRDYSEDGILFKYRAAAFIQIIIETFKNIWNLFQTFIVLRNILPLIRKVEWVLAVSQKVIWYISCAAILGAFQSLWKKRSLKMTW